MFQLNPNLRDFWRTRKPYKLLKGGRFSGKTHDAAGMAAYLARNYTVKFMCVRQFQNRISDSVYTVIRQKIEQAGWESEFDIGVSTIRHRATGSEFLFYGMARNLTDIKGTEGVDICWIEEGEGLTEEQWAIIDPTIRKAGAEIWILWNPRYQTDFVQTKLPGLLGDACIIRHINYDENPFLADTARDKAERLKAVEPEAYAHVYLGQPLASSDNTVIPLLWLQSCIDAHVKLGFEPSGAIRAALDVADQGADLNALCIRHGQVVVSVDSWSGQNSDIMQTTERAFRLCDAAGAADLTYDADGLGVGVRGDARVINERRAMTGQPAIAVKGFQGSGKVISPEKRMIEGRKNVDAFANAKAQAWWSLRMRVERTHRMICGQQDYPLDDLISIPAGLPNLSSLLAELAQPTYTENAAGKFVVDKAPDGTKSPNLADSVMIAFAPTRGGLFGA